MIREWLTEEAEKAVEKKAKKEAKKEGQWELAKRMVKDGLDPAMITRYTDLSMSDLGKLTHNKT